MGSENLQNLDVSWGQEPGGVVGRVSPLRAGLAVSDDGAHGVTRPTRFMGSLQYQTSTFPIGQERVVPPWRERVKGLVAAVFKSLG